MNSDERKAYFRKYWLDLKNDPEKYAVYKDKFNEKRRNQYKVDKEYREQQKHNAKIYHHKNKGYYSPCRNSKQFYAGFYTFLLMSKLPLPLPAFCYETKKPYQFNNSVWY